MSRTIQIQYLFDHLNVNLTLTLSSFSQPLFITWNTITRASKNPRLRGCIGTFEPHPLKEGLAEYALISAFQDTRFRRVEKRELPSLQCVWVIYFLMPLCFVFGTCYSCYFECPEGEAWEKDVVYWIMQCRGISFIHSIINNSSTPRVIDKNLSSRFQWCTPFY